MICMYCGKSIVDVVFHIYIECVNFNDTRVRLWDTVVDTVDVPTSVQLFQMDDELWLQALLGRCILPFQRHIELLIAIIDNLVVLADAINNIEIHKLMYR